MAVATGFANIGMLTSSSGDVLAEVTLLDTLRIREIIEGFTRSGLVATSQLAFYDLSPGVARHIGGLLGGATLIHQEIGRRGDTLGSEWTLTSLRGQIDYLRDRTAELDARVDVTHQSFGRLEAKMESIDRGIVMAAAIGSTYVEKGERGHIDVSLTDLGDRQGFSIGMGLRVALKAQLNFAIASTHDADERVMRFGSHIQF